MSAALRDQFLPGGGRSDYGMPQPREHFAVIIAHILLIVGHDDA